MMQIVKCIWLLYNFFYITWALLWTLNYFSNNGLWCNLWFFFNQVNFMTDLWCNLWKCTVVFEHIVHDYIQSICSSLKVIIRINHNNLIMMWKAMFGISVILIFIYWYFEIHWYWYSKIPPENISRLIFTDIIKLVRYQ